MSDFAAFDNAFGVDPFAAATPSKSSRKSGSNGVHETTGISKSATDSSRSKTSSSSKSGSSSRKKTELNQDNSGFSPDFGAFDDDPFGDSAFADASFPDSNTAPSSSSASGGHNHAPASAGRRAARRRASIGNATSVPAPTPVPAEPEVAADASASRPARPSRTRRASTAGGPGPNLRQVSSSRSCDGLEEMRMAATTTTPAARSTSAVVPSSASSIKSADGGQRGPRRGRRLSVGGGSSAHNPAPSSSPDDFGDAFGANDGFGGNNNNNAFANDDGFAAFDETIVTDYGYGYEDTTAGNHFGQFDSMDASQHDDGGHGGANGTTGGGQNWLKDRSQNQRKLLDDFRSGAVASTGPSSGKPRANNMVVPMTAVPNVAVEAEQRRPRRRASITGVMGAVTDATVGVVGGAVQGVVGGALGAVAGKAQTLDNDDAYDKKAGRKGLFKDRKGPTRGHSADDKVAPTYDPSKDRDRGGSLLNRVNAGERRPMERRGSTSGGGNYSDRIAADRGGGVGPASNYSDRIMQGR